MLDDCYCDYDPPSVFRCKDNVKARKYHRCGECGCDINPGETYEYAFGVWDGCAYDMKTCVRCRDLRNHALIALPCFCWCYQSMLDDLRDTIDWKGYLMKDEAPGALFAIGRLAVAVRRRQMADFRARTAERFRRD